MPDRFDKAVCAAELRLRGDILSKIRPGRRPQLSFEVEDKEAESSSGEDIESTETSTCPVAVRAYGDIPNLENDAPRFEDFI